MIAGANEELLAMLFRSFEQAQDQSRALFKSISSSVASQ